MRSDVREQAWKGIRSWDLSCSRGKASKSLKLGDNNEKEDTSSFSIKNALERICRSISSF